MSNVWFKMCLSHMHASIYVCDRPCNQAAMLFFTKKEKLKREKNQFSPRCKTIPPPSVFNTFQIDFSSHVNCMKCANQRLQIDIVLRLSSSTEKKAKFTIRHTYAPKSIEGDYTQNIV